ncbi:MAG: sodium-translocating pyrophosphatase [Candidatus Diapherotrites archaeon]|uniref:Putative K(+)-stimulated pyrophosphate-energized sodium pump n=1 Tax=Candidatus Iainarchaeum sp. TaxID=3101447 RepID=A0A2D6M1G2_9ARCH|nr:sodium-translocating pyrophosphatase [Candidatus Diapherotrites archaeon]
MPFIWISFIAIVALAFALFTYLRIMKRSPGSKEMQEVSDLVHDGALAFLNKEYQILIVFVAIVSILLFFGLGTITAGGFILGAFLSALSGNIGMRIATKANARTAEAAKKSVGDALRLAFSSGMVSGMTVVGFGLLGLTVLYYFVNDPVLLYGFGFGASSVALFARVGGGIFTKAADVGADLVGKVEAGIPEDSPKNPATIADNVGDNVGDVAGMGADLFESYVDSIIAAMVLGVLVLPELGALIPLSLAALGIVASIIGSIFVRTKNHDVFSALDRGIIASAVITAILAYILISQTMPDLNVFYAMLSGIISGVLIGYSIKYFTSSEHYPTREIAMSAQTGAGTSVINGLSVGMMSTIGPILFVSIAILVSYYFAGLFGIAIAAVGMLSIVGVTLATDTFGSVSDNSQGIAEMTGMGKKVLERTAVLDAVGNSTAAIGKGFAISSAALTTIALFASYIQITGLASIDLSIPVVMVGLFLGAFVPFLFSSLTMSAVGKAAHEMVKEVRRQFKEIPEILQGTAKPDYNKCIEISTEGAIKSMIIPGLIAILFPLAVGLSLGVEALGGFLAGSIATGFLMAVFMANSGAAWDNAKKWIEQGNIGGKKSPAHKAAVVGDTIGDPFKDTAGPSLNILIKLMTIVALVVAPLII